MWGFSRRRTRLKRFSVKLMIFYIVDQHCHVQEVEDYQHHLDLHEEVEEAIAVIDEAIAAMDEDNPDEQFIILVVDGRARVIRLNNQLAVGPRWLRLSD